jgi:energy-coupling factor transporter ATP-binding protein EcfA2
MSRPRPQSVIVLALVSASVFLLLRVLYRAIFGGAGGSGEVLFEIPRYQLWGVFSHILIGGDVTSGGLLTSVTSGLPFAAVIVTSGVMLAWWDPRGLILVIPRIRRGKNLVTAGVIALSTLPVLVAVVRDTRRAASRRKVALGRRIVLPVLEKTLEHAAAIQSALISRGILEAPRKTRSTQSSAVMLDGLTWPERGLHNVSAVFGEGRLSIVTGQTGSGKTSLLEVIAGLHPHIGKLGGGTAVNPGVNIGYLPHHPQRIFLSSTVCDEVSLSLVTGGMSRPEAIAHASRLLEDWGLSHLSRTHPSELSAGEALKVGLLVLVTHSPNVLILDEPLHSLDARSRKGMVQRLHHLVSSGVAVIMSDHRSGELGHQDGEFFTLTSGGLQPGRYPSPSPDAPLVISRPLPEPDVVARFEQLSAAFGDRRVFGPLDVQMRRGHITLISGDNGVGKTTLLEMIADADSRKAPVAFVPSEPSDLFFTDSVRLELELSDRASEVAPGTTRMSLEAILSGTWRADILERVSETHPRDLSRGQQMALAIAIQMSQRPAVLALDEPTAGLDDAAVDMLMAVLTCAMETGVALLIATQEPDAFASLEGTRLRLHDGELTAMSGVSS